MRLNESCVACMLDKKLKNYPAGAAREKVEEYQRRARTAIEEGRAYSSPVVTARVSAIYRDVFGPERDYTDIKRRFNALMLALEPAIQAEVDAAPDPLERAVQYAMVGNYIDFAAIEDVNEGELQKKLAVAEQMIVDPEMLSALRREALSAQRLVLFTDNCGEIVADKVLLRVLGRLNPWLEITVIVRGVPVVNDATLEDAAQVNMGEVARQVIGSGCDLPGTVPEYLGPEARDAAEAADVWIAKGQANYEGLSECGRNVFYIFMCKCDMFTRRFGVTRFSGVLTREGAGKRE